MTKNYTQIAARCALIASVFAIAVISSVGLAVDILDSFFKLIGFDLHEEVILNKYPLGFWGALLVYIAGALSGFLALRHPRPYGGLLLVDGVVAIAFGGQLALVFGIIAIVCGSICIFKAR